MAGEQSEGRWLIPSAAIVATVMAGAGLLTFITGYRSPPPWWDYLFAWAAFALIVAAGLALGGTVIMALRRTPDPMARMIEQVKASRTAAAAFMLAGLMQIGFNWMKPQLAMLTGFWADPLLADMDAAIFGADAWRALAFLMPLQPALDYVYSLWFPALIVSLALVALQRPSPERSVALLSYFLLWGVFGPIGQLLVPAAGPMFYERIGLGPRFAELVAALPFGSANAGNYLWQRHIGQANGIAVGISAMPSMHVAMAFWIVLACRRSKAMPLALAYFAAVLLGSVLLAWHYLVDGLAGAVGALLCWRLAASGSNRRNSGMKLLKRITLPYWIAIALGLVLSFTKQYWADYTPGL